MSVPDWRMPERSLRASPTSGYMQEKVLGVEIIEMLTTGSNKQEPPPQRSLFTGIAPFFLLFRIIKEGSHPIAVKNAVQEAKHALGH